jgi:hypothetical protein
MKQVTQLALVALTMGLAACGDVAVAPKSQAADSPSAIGGGSNASLSAWDTVRFTFVIDPSRNINYSLGAGNSITFPAHSLCDPSRSSYGNGEWDKPCTLASAPITIHAVAWLDGQHHPHIDFSPSVRFVPTSNPLGWVKISFTDYAASWLPLATIGYCKQLADKNCTDESTKDLTMVTVKDPITGRLTRRIKHFSGYNVFSGRDDGGDSSFSMGTASVGSAAPSGRDK